MFRPLEYLYVFNICIYVSIIEWFVRSSSMYYANAIEKGQPYQREVCNMFEIPLDENGDDAFQLSILRAFLYIPWVELLTL